MARAWSGSCRWPAASASRRHSRPAPPHGSTGACRPQADAVIEQAEAHVQHTAGGLVLVELDQQFVVTVDDEAPLPPRLLPAAVAAGGLRAVEHHLAEQRIAVGQVEAEA